MINLGISPFRLGEARRPRTTNHHLQLIALQYDELAR